MSAESWTAVVLTGGASTRLGEDKSRVVLGTQSTLAMILEQIPNEVPIVVVGPDSIDVPKRVECVREDPIGAGPAAAVSAALDVVHTDVIGVLATDMPFAVSLLVELQSYLQPDVDAVLAVDDSGQQQYLCASYRVTALRAAMQESMTNRSMRDVVAELRIREVRADGGDVLLDIDTPEDLHRARHLASSKQGKGS
jgi:molybdopterin-guanine dinucleotide biosynthesis protein A